MQTNGSITILLPFELKTVAVIGCEHLACFGHIHLEPIPAVVNVDKELEKQVLRKGAFSVRKARASVLKPLSGPSDIVAA